MLSQGNSLWYFPAGKRRNAIPLIINTLYCAAPIGRWICLHAFLLDRGQPSSLSVCPCALLASWPLPFPFSAILIPPSLAKSLAHWLKVIMISGWRSRGRAPLCLNLISNWSHSAITSSNTPHLFLPAVGHIGIRLFPTSSLPLTLTTGFSSI